MPTYYETLGVSEDASQREIKKAYRNLIRIYHPDVNPDIADAEQKTREINIAYSVLKDPVKRANYDSTLSIQFDYLEDEFYQEEASFSPNEIPDYKCEECGKVNSTLRLSIFLDVMSFLFYSEKRGHPHILCSKCRIKKSLFYNLKTFLFGWWSLAGIVFTIEALFQNLKGGIQPRENNSALLYLIAYKKFFSNNYSESYNFLYESYIIEPAEEKKNLLEYLKYNHGPFKKKSRINIFSNPAIYNVAFLIILITISSYLIGQIDWNSEQRLNSYSSQDKTTYQKTKIDWRTNKLDDSFLLIEAPGIFIPNKKQDLDYEKDLILREDNNVYESSDLFILTSYLKIKDLIKINIYDFEKSTIEFYKEMEEITDLKYKSTPTEISEIKGRLVSGHFNSKSQPIGFSELILLENNNFWNIRIWYFNNKQNYSIVKRVLNSINIYRDFSGNTN